MSKINFEGFIRTIKIPNNNLVNGPFNFELVFETAIKYVPRERKSYYLHNS